MGRRINEAVEHVDGYAEFDDYRRDAEIRGGENADTIHFDKLIAKSDKASSKADIDINGNGGVDTLEYSTRKSIDMKVTDKVGYEFELDGGYSHHSARIKDLDVWTDSIEVFRFDKGWDTADLRGSSLSDITVFSGDGGDRLQGSEQRDLFYGESGNDTLDGNGGNDVLSGGEGHDDIDGGIGSDIIDGGGDNDTIDGGSGGDVIDGGVGHDVIRGGAGDDTITGGDGNDILTAGDGGFDTDTFMFDLNDGADTITDFIDDEIYVLGATESDFSVSSTSSSTTLHFGLTTVTLEGMGNLDKSDFEFDYDGIGTTVDLAPVTTGNANDTVICTYMFARGYIAAEVYKWDGVYGQRLGAEVLAGYHAWAMPLVEHVLKRSEIATQMIRPLACAWALEMAHRCDPETHPKGSALGRAILTVGVPLCRVIARLNRASAPIAAD